MSHLDVLLDTERRRDPRVRVEMFLNQYVEDEPARSLAVNVSHTGLYVQKLVEPVARQTRVVGLEFELPGTGEIIWASAESRFDRLGDYFHVSGLRFVGMARKHERLLRDFVTEKRLRELRWIRQNRILVPN
ncbi:MAG TPA: PilZ domain-containing protein [Polyangia bacterium]